MYDAVLIMSVFIDLKFPQYNELLDDIHKHVKTGGYIVMYNSRFLFAEYNQSSCYTSVAQKCAKDVGVIDSVECKSEIARRPGCHGVPGPPPGLCGDKEFCIEGGGDNALFTPAGDTILTNTNLRRTASEKTRQTDQSARCQYPGVFFQKSDSCDADWSIDQVRSHKQAEEFKTKQAEAERSGSIISDTYSIISDNSSQAAAASSGEAGAAPAGTAAESAAHTFDAD
jgi:hypothetical protein